MARIISKSKYMAGLSCPKLLWCHFNDPGRIPPVDAQTQAIFDQGHEVELLAKKQYPKGITIELNNDAEANTKKALAKRVPIFEGTFLYNNCYCKVDILEPIHKDEWDLIEVKSATEVKDEYYDDTGFQLYVLRGCGLKIRKVHIITVNNEYVRKGKIDIKQLFTKDEVTEQAEEKAQTIADITTEFQKTISGPIPKVQLGTDCKEPKKCPICSTEIENIEICTLYLFGKKAWPLVNTGIMKLKDLPNSVKLNEKQKIQYDSVKLNKPHIDKNAIKTFISNLKFPISCFDFETVNPAIPMFDGLRPYQKLPFQFSLHIINSFDEKPKHVEFLSEGTKDPRPALLKALEAIPAKGTVLAFNMCFEIGVLEELAEYSKKHSKTIHSITERMQDLIAPFRNFSYYHPAQLGSCSLKSVLPALTGRNYSGMLISEGGGASEAFLSIIQGKKPETPETRQALLEYCQLDTEGMVDILKVLRDVR